jgi:hypothetical protein
MQARQSHVDNDWLALRKLSAHIQSNPSAAMAGVFWLASNCPAP